MKGEKQILAARLAGHSPKTVFIEAGLPPQPERFAFEKYENALAAGLFATVNIPPGEINRRYDFRFLVGLRVIVQADTLDDDVLMLGERIAEAGASHIVLSAFNDTALMQFKNNEWEAWA